MIASHGLPLRKPSVDGDRSSVVVGQQVVSDQGLTLNQRSAAAAVVIECTINAKSTIVGENQVDLIQCGLAAIGICAAKDDGANCLVDVCRPDYQRAEWCASRQVILDNTSDFERARCRVVLNRRCC